MTMRPIRPSMPRRSWRWRRPQRNFAYTLLLSPDFSKPDALAIIDVKPGSPTYGQVVHTVTMPNKGDEFHHFGWNACSSALSPLTGHAFLERRYLIIPGIRSSRIYVDRHQAASDAGQDPQDHRAGGGVPQNRLLAAAHRSIADRRASTSARSAAAARMAPTARPASSSWTARHSRSSAAGRSTADRRQALRFLVEPAARLHGDERMGAAAAIRERHRARGPACQQIRPPRALLGLARRVATCRRSTSAPTTRWRSRCGPPTTRCGNTAFSASSSTPPISKGRSGRGGGRAANSTSRRRRRSRPSRRQQDKLPPLLQGFGAVPPLVTDIDLSLDDRFLYVACWGTGEMRQYDVTEPRKPEAGRLGPCRRHRTAHAAPERQDVRRRPADGRDQPRRQARLLDQLALFDVG